MPQAEVNIMTAGHVDHGKTSLVTFLTGHNTDTHSEEVKRGITIKLGYADAWIYKCPQCKPPHDFSMKKVCPNCGKETQAARHVSFVDAPGHETLMATVVAASSIVDGALFVIAANEECPQPQTLEHLMVLEAAGIKNVIVAQTKVDIVEKAKAVENHRQIREMLKGTAYENAPIIPVSSITGANLDALCGAIQQDVATPVRDEGANPVMFIARSFDVNLPGTRPQKIVGGVVGGSIVRGVLREGEEVEILPGMLHVHKEKESYKPLKTRIASLNAGGAVKEARPGGLVGIGTLLDPALTRADALVGNFLGRPGTLPPVVNELALEITAVKRQIAKFPEGFAQAEPLVLGIGTATTIGFVQGKAKGKGKKAIALKLKKPVCANPGDMMAVLRRSSNRWHLYGTGKIV
ncbi:translation initiation factor IF-2 subunit gamma [Candidatus Micrarchaeota archaeon]|nr:translation initiation factor IF-2 subunit gamma [Candidatus Micrarchaeota archaeon]